MSGIVNEMKGSADQQTQAIRPSAQAESQRAFAVRRVPLQLAAVVFLQQGVCSSKVPISWTISVSFDFRQNVFLIH